MHSLNTELCIEFHIKFVAFIIKFNSFRNKRMSEFQLSNPPSDGISCVKFAPNSSQHLLVSSWDSSVR